jgi:hypothetical protein
MRYYWDIGGEGLHHPTKQMTITARSASDVQLALMAVGVFMVDMGNTGLAVSGYRFQLHCAGEIERFVTLQQVKTWAKYNLG